MTPLELTLKNELDLEVQHFRNRWLFRWHEMQRKEVKVEDFKGGFIHVGGIVFQGQIQKIYWEAIDRYLRNKIHEVFKRWDVETAGYPAEQRRSALEGSAGLLRSFVDRNCKTGVEVDRALRGRGNPNSVPSYVGPEQEGLNAEIARLQSAHGALLAPTTSGGRLKRLEKWYSDNKALVWIIGLILGGLSLLVKMF